MIINDWFLLTLVLLAQQQFIGFLACWSPGAPFCFKAMDYDQPTASVDSSRPDDSTPSDTIQTPSTTQTASSDPFQGYFSTPFQPARITFQPTPSSTLRTGSIGTLQTLPEDPHSSPKTTKPKMAAANNMHNLTTLIKR